MEGISACDALPELERRPWTIIHEGEWLDTVNLISRTYRTY
jgi:hypothetical protein